MGAMFPLPRVVYAMSSDGLIFEWMGRVNERFQTPTYGTLFVGSLTAILAALLELDALIDMMSIGTMLAYSIVAASVLLLRYDIADDDEQTLDDCAPFKPDFLRHLWNIQNLQTPNKLTATIVSVEVAAYCKD